VAAVAEAEKDDGVTLEELTRKFENQVSELKRFCASCGVGNEGSDLTVGGPDAPEACLPPAQQAECQAMVAGVLHTCFRLSRLEGPDLQELVAASVEDCTSLEEGWPDSAPAFRAAVAAIALRPEQTARLLKLRRRWLRELEKLYATRQGLNLQLIAVLLPPVVAPGSGDAALPSQAGDEKRAVDLVHDLEDSLRAEQQLWCKQDRELFEVLSPLQGAVFIVATAPSHCDPLALANAIAEAEGDASSDSDA